MHDPATTIRPPSTDPSVDVCLPTAPRQVHRRRRPSSPLPCFHAWTKTAEVVATPLPGSPQAERVEWHDRSYWIRSPLVTPQSKKLDEGQPADPEWVFRPLSTKPRPTWCNRFHVSDSQANSVVHHLRRQYFDALPNLQITTKIVSSRSHHNPVSRRSLKSGSSAAPKKHGLEVEVEAEVDDKVEGSKKTPATPKKPVDPDREILGAVDIMQKRVSALYKEMAHEPGMKPFVDFYMWCIKKFKNLTRAWRLLDSSLNMRLTYLEFLTSLKEHGYKGDGRVIFKILDRDRSGSLSYFHFDPSGASALATLLVWAEENFGSVQGVLEKLDKDRNGKLSPDEFRHGARTHGLQSDEPISYLFQMLDLDKNMLISKEEVHFLDAWCCPPWLKAQPDPEGFQAFKEQFVCRYRDNPIIAWQQLDQNDQMRVSWDEFVFASKKCGKVGFDESRLPGVWRALDLNMSGWVALNEFSNEAYTLLVKFKKWAEQKEGTIFKFFGTLDTNRDGVISRKEFGVVKADLGLTNEEYSMLFHGFDPEGKGSIRFSRFRFLDMWNIEEDLREEEFWNRISSCLRLTGSVGISG